MSNCMILTEGFDLPDIGCIVLARPTRSLGLFRQMIGRELRPAENKSDIVILDHSGGVYRHGRPDDAIQWNLDTDKKAANITHEARVAKSGTDPFCRMQGLRSLANERHGLRCLRLGAETARRVMSK